MVQWDEQLFKRYGESLDPLSHCYQTMSSNQSWQVKISKSLHSSFLFLPCLYCFSLSLHSLPQTVLHWRGQGSTSLKIMKLPHLFTSRGQYYLTCKLICLNKCVHSWLKNKYSLLCSLICCWRSHTSFSPFHIISLTEVPCLHWQKHTNTEWPITSNHLIVLLSSLGTPVYGSHVLEGGDGGGVGIGTSFFFFFEHFSHFPFRSHLQTLINRQSHQIKLYQSQRCCQQATGTDAPNATFSSTVNGLVSVFVNVCIGRSTGARVQWQWQVLLLIWRHQTLHSPIIHVWICLCGLLIYSMCVCSSAFVFM